MSASNSFTKATRKKIKKDTRSRIGIANDAYNTKFSLLWLTEFLLRNIKNMNLYCFRFLRLSHMDKICILWKEQHDEVDEKYTYNKRITINKYIFTKRKPVTWLFVLVLFCPKHMVLWVKIWWHSYVRYTVKTK